MLLQKDDPINTKCQEKQVKATSSHQPVFNPLPRRGPYQFFPNQPFQSLGPKLNVTVPKHQSQK
jgi:hypothetical protein